MSGSTANTGGGGFDDGSSLSSSSSNDNVVVLACCIAVTLQLLRLSIDLVQVASKKESKKEKDLLKKKNLTDTTTTATNNGRYGSVSSSSISGNNKDSSSEKQPLIQQKLKSDEEIGASVVNNNDGAVSTTGTSLLLPKALLFAQIILALCLMIIAAFFNTDGTMFSSKLIYCTFFVLVLGSIISYRDYPVRERFGSCQKYYYMISTMSLFVTYIMEAINNTSSNTIAVIDYVVLVLVTFYLLLSIIECYFVVIVAPDHEDEDTTPASGEPLKKTLSREAILILIKPYIWPDATAESAVRNRFFAVMTWVCVILGRGLNVYAPLYLGWASTELAHQEYYKCMRYAILYALIQFFSSSFREGQSIFYLKIEQAAFINLSTTVFAKLHSLSLDWHLRKKLGEVIRVMDRGVLACNTLMKYLFLWMIPALLECVAVSIIFVVYFNYIPLGISTFYFVFVYVIWTIVLTLWRKKFRKQVTLSDNEWHDRCTDSLINFESVKYFTAEDYEVERFSESIANFQQGNVNVQGSLSFLNISQKLIMQSCMATSLSLAVYGIMKRSDCCTSDINNCESAISDCCREISVDQCPGMEVGDFVAVLTYTLNLFQPLNFLGSVYNAVVMALVDLSSLAELMAEASDVVDAPDAIDLKNTSTNNNDDIAIEFDNVVFRYPTQPANKGLKGLSFKMKRGTTTAIVGPTGAGKTTVSRLLFRFYDVLGGSIRVNGTDVRSVTQKSLRDLIGVVPQVATMFNDTIAKNIMYGKRNSSQEEVKKACDDAQLSTFIESLDKGFESQVGDRGLKLSGGEKQRAAIARCLLKDPPFVLLDEATSSLDTLTENSIQGALDRLGEERTVLVIAHRLGTIRNADNIIVLKDGVVCEEGKHDDLLAKPSGVYAEMWNMQLHSTSASNSRSNFIES